MKCPECSHEVDLRRAAWMSPFFPARCKFCGYVLQFRSMLWGMIYLMSLLGVITLGLFILRSCH
jgi:hypothetical protein